MDTVNSESVAEGSALRLVDEFSAFGPCYLKWVRSQLQDCGLSYARMRLLGTLHCKGPQIMSDISDDLGVTRRNVTALVDALEDEGLARRVPHPTDRRATVIELTEQGVKMANSMYSGYREAVSELFTHLSEDERHELMRLLGSLRKVLRREGISC